MEIEKRLGAPDYTLEDGAEWHYLQEDVSRLHFMEFSKILILRFKGGKVVDAAVTD